VKLYSTFHSTFRFQHGYLQKYCKQGGGDVAITDMQAKATTVPEGKKQLRLSDSGGLFLLVKQNGKYWRMDYTFADKRKTFSIGVYPTVSLKQARKARDDAKAVLASGTDPNTKKKRAKLAAISQSKTFKGIAVEMIAKKATKWSAGYKKDVEARLQKHVYPWLGSFPITDIRTPDVLAIIRRIEDTGSIETAHRMRNMCGQVFRYAIAIGLLEYDPTYGLAGALTPKNPIHRPCLKDAKQVGELMRAIESFKGTFVVKCAFRLSPLLMLRPGELRQMKWAYIDFDTQQIAYPAEVMKVRTAHVVPLSVQAIAVLKELQQLTGSSEYVFPNIRKPASAMSDGTINKALRSVGYDTKIKHCAHGFRGTASTLLRSLQYNHEWIEVQLAHKVGNEVSRAYNHYQYLPERTSMMQAWADYLDGLRSGADVIPIKRKA